MTSLVRHIAIIGSVAPRPAAVVGALTEAGVSKEDAPLCAEGVRRGGTLVSAKVADADRTRLDSILNRSSVNLKGRKPRHGRRRVGLVTIRPVSLLERRTTERAQLIRQLTPNWPVKRANSSRMDSGAFTTVIERLVKAGTSRRVEVLLYELRPTWTTAPNSNMSGNENDPPNGYHRCCCRR